MLDNKFGSLSGKILAAAPQVSPKSYFAKRVIYLVKHGLNDGAIGLIVNQPLVQNTNDMFVKYKTQTHPDTVVDKISLGKVTTYAGGPLEGETGFILHADCPKNDEEIYISSSLQLLKSILKGKGPKQSMFLFGYCGWEHGQLEEEIKNNIWLVLDADKKLIFDTNNVSKWKRSAKQFKYSTSSILDKSRTLLTNERFYNRDKRRFAPRKFGKIWSKVWQIFFMPRLSLHSNCNCVCVHQQ